MRSAKGGRLRVTNDHPIRPFCMTAPRFHSRPTSRSVSAALLAMALGVALAACTGVDGRPESAPVVVTTDAVESSAAARSGDAARDQTARAPAASSASSASASASSSAAAASSAAEAARVAAEQQAAADQARQQAEQEAAASAAAEAERAAAEQAAAEQAAEDEAERQATADQAQFDAALSSGQCSEAPADRVTECVGLAEDSVPPGDAGADGASPDDGSQGWYDGRGWVSPETAQRAIAAGIPVGGDVPNYLRCGTLCGESPTSGEIQYEWAQQQGLIDENGAPVGDGG